MEAGQGVIWDRFTPVLRGLVEKSNGFRTAMEAFRSKISGRYFVTCANVRYPPWGGEFFAVFRRNPDVEIAGHAGDTHRHQAHYSNPIPEQDIGAPSLMTRLSWRRPDHVVTLAPWFLVETTPFQLEAPPSPPVPL